MANFGLIRAMGWTPLTRLLASEMQAFDVAHTKTANFAEGSSHAPTSQVVVGGAGIRITLGTSTTETVGNIALPAGFGLISVNSVTGFPATGQLYSPNLNTWISYTGTAPGFFTGCTGGTGTLTVGMVLEMPGFELDATSLLLQDAGGVASFFGTIYLGASGLLDLLSGSNLQTETGSTATFLGNVLFNANTSHVTNGGVFAWLSSSVLDIFGSSVLNIGDTASGGTGRLNVNKDSLLEVNGASGHLATLDIGQYGFLQVSSSGIVEVKSGGTLQADTGSHVQLVMDSSSEIHVLSSGLVLFDAGGLLHTDMPASNVGPAANNILSLGVAKAWGKISTSGPTVVDGFNVQNPTKVSIAGSANAGINVQLVTHMASGDYAIVCGAYAQDTGLALHHYDVYSTANTSSDITFGFIEDDSSVVLAPYFWFAVFGRQ